MGPTKHFTYAVDLLIPTNIWRKSKISTRLSTPTSCAEKS